MPPSIKSCTYFSTSLASNPLHAIQKQFYHFSATLFPPTFAQIDTPSHGFLKKLPLAMFIFTKWNMFVPKRYLWKKICSSTSCNHMCLFNKPPIYSKTTLRNRWPSRIVAANSSHAINLTRCRHRGWGENLWFWGCGCNTVDGQTSAPVVLNVKLFISYLSVRWCRIFSINSMDMRGLHPRSLT